jgi:hypothetical protein
MAFYLEQRLAPGETEIPMEHLRAERTKVQAREANQSTRPLLKSAPGGIVSWNALGPGNIGGRTRAIVFDPTNPNTVYAAGVAGGIWKSTDGGLTWNVADDLMLNLAVCALAIDPTDPDVLYAGTGEGYYGSNVFVRGLGIFKSTDAGASWAQLSGTVSGVPEGAFYYVNKIRISPNDADRILPDLRPQMGATWVAPILRSARIETPMYCSPRSEASRRMDCTAVMTEAIPGRSTPRERTRAA